MIQEPGIVPRDPEPDGAWAGSLASNCRAPEWAGLGSPRGSPRVGGPGLGVTAWGGGAGCRVTHKGFCRLSADCHPELLPPVGAGEGRFYWQAPRAGGPPASSARAGLSSWWPWELTRRSTPRVADEETEARGRWQGLGLALGFAALSGLACVCGGSGASQAQGRGDPSLSRGGRGPHR